MLDFNSIIDQIKNLLDHGQGLSEREIYEQLNVNGLSKTELKVLLKFQINKKWKLSESKYIGLSDQSEKDLYKCYRELIENNDKEKAYEMLIKLNLYYSEKQEYLIERALMAKELNKPEQSEIWAKAMERLNLTASNQHDHIDIRFTTNTPGKKFYFVQLGVFRKAPFVISVTDPSNQGIQNYYILPSTLPPENLLSEHKVTVESLVSAQTEKEVLSIFINKIDNSSLLFGTRYEKEIFIERLIVNNITLPGLITSMEDLCDLLGLNYVSLSMTAEKLESYKKIASLYSNETAFLWMQKYDNDYVELSFLKRYTPDLNGASLSVEDNTLIMKYTIPNNINDLLGIGGILAKSGYNFRETQLKLSQDIHQNMQKAGVLIADAPAGIGKSYAYLAASLLKINEGERIIISTFTKSLQNQIIRDIPSFFNKFELPITTVQLQGISNYICLERVKVGGDQFLVNWIDQHQKYFVSEIPSTLLEASDRKILSVNHSECTQEKCPSFSKCLYYKAIKEINSADIVVTNHYSLFNALSNVESKVHLILDEGHHITEAIMDAFSFDFNPNDFLKQLVRLDSIISGSLSNNLINAIKVISEN
ncbi:DEAD/DEAH box helicase [Paenibacillus albus]|uniref:DNA 5'-3' helicase n=1 Tax=Paenibacillus albus TaxID=2495582 RepID=A0A3S9A1A7_9BACL|nr:DEAD/DEAH box helicase [Paenibacillus albus]AZN39553.1 hypothetical protein EJC50_07665 [Paenibacillus albus]